MWKNNKCVDALDSKGDVSECRAIHRTKDCKANSECVWNSNEEMCVDVYDWKSVMDCDTVEATEEHICNLKAIKAKVGTPLANKQEFNAWCKDTNERRCHKGYVGKHPRRAFGCHGDKNKITGCAADQPVPKCHKLKGGWDPVGNKKMTKLEICLLVGCDAEFDSPPSGGFDGCSGKPFTN
jgi:hypothetical protein